MKREERKRVREMQDEIFIEWLKRGSKKKKRVRKRGGRD